MKYHLSIFWNILKQALAYMLVPGVLYLIYYLVLIIFNLPELNEQINALLLDALILITVIYYFRLNTPEKIRELFYEKLSLKKILSLIPLSILVRVPLLILVVVMVVLFGDTFMNTIDEGVSYQWEGFTDLTGLGYIVAILSFSVLGPIHEELFFRGVIYNYLKRYYNIRTSIIYSTVVFTLFHIHPGLYPSSFILGLFLVLVYQKWNNLSYSIILHMLINLHPFLIDFISSKV
ncbi:CPBP family intramembrane metalloprotease [Candidatus Roizmanbacteria bacterium]|nr:MAG: CPBP family intramembrane metalloprotease [Candidatus Roizmanbacteria bacterium]